MKLYYTLSVGGQEYRLRLTASAIMAIEKKMGKSLILAFEDLQENMVETIITVLWGALQPLNSNFPFEKAAELFDQYIDDGNYVEDIIQELINLFEVSGFFKKGQD